MQKAIKKISHNSKKHLKLHNICFLAHCYQAGKYQPKKFLDIIETQGN